VPLVVLVDEVFERKVIAGSGVHDAIEDVGCEQEVDICLQNSRFCELSDARSEQSSCCHDGGFTPGGVQGLEGRRDLGE